MTRSDRGDMTAFVRAVELGGFSAAARVLKLTPSALSKLVTRLEARLGARLLNRSTRRLSLTPEGGLFYERCRGIIADIENAENEVMRSRERPRGRLRLHVAVGFAVHQVMPALPRFMRRYPDVEIDMVVEDRKVELVKEDLDISVRPGPADDASLVVRKVFDFQAIVCAAPDYLARHGSPASPEELLQHQCIALSGFSAHPQWPFETNTGRRVIEVVPHLRLNNADCALRAALAGLGIVRLNEFVVAEALQRGRLVPVLRDCQSTETRSMLAMLPRTRHRLPRVSAMLDFLIETFGHAPWLTATPRETGVVGARRAAGAIAKRK